jgi:hypothetical protein
MKTQLPPEFAALDATAREFDRLMHELLAQAQSLSAERAELERLHQVASTARVTNMSFMVEAAAVFLRDPDRKADKPPLARIDQPRRPALLH